VNTTVDGEVARYAAAVRAAFADLPAPDRETLLEDIEDHLVEVAAESGGPLEERLGPPETYAAELRAWAGLPAPGAARRRGPRTSRLARRLEGLLAAAAAHPAGGAVVEFLPELRPAWWVLRGYLVVQLASVGLSYLFAGDGLSFPLPTILGSQVLGLLAVGAAVVGSVALGRRGTATRRGRRLTIAANLALGLFALFLLGDLGATRYAAEAYYDQYAASGSYLQQPGLRSDGREISNIFPYDAKGKPLKGVRLYDQDGVPLVATHEDNPELESRLPLDAAGDAVANRYPREQFQVDPATGERRPVPAPTPQP
jgi:hypothetical protein